VAGKHEGTAPERLRKGLMAAAVADNDPQATVAAEVDMECGKAGEVNIVGPHTASSTTNGHPDRPGKVGERAAGGRSADS
jgi:hypothetical protein